MPDDNQTSLGPIKHSKLSCGRVSRISILDSTSAEGLITDFQQKFNYWGVFFGCWFHCTRQHVVWHNFVQIQTKFPGLGRGSWSVCFSCIRLFVLYVLVFVIFLLLLVSGVGCGLRFWHSLHFSINFLQTFFETSLAFWRQESMSFSPSESTHRHRKDTNYH